MQTSIGSKRPRRQTSSERGSNALPIRRGAAGGARSIVRCSQVPSAFLVAGLMARRKPWSHGSLPRAPLALNLTV
jgi:hypothetical protein